MGRRRVWSTIGAGRKRMETPHATAERPEQVPRRPAPGQHVDRGHRAEPVQLAGGRDRPGPRAADRKSTRLNSSHANISYAVFCLKKKKRKKVNIIYET